MRRPGALPLGVVPLPVLVAALVTGCAAYERVDIIVDPHPARTAFAGGSHWDARARPGLGRGIPAWYDRLRGGATHGPRGAATNAPVRLTLGSSSPTDRAALSLVALALQRVAAAGGPRSILDGLEHFARAGLPRFVIHLDHRDGRGRETWIIDRAWALRKLDGGGVLVWQGELGPVLRSLSLVLPPRMPP